MDSQNLQSQLEKYEVESISLKDLRGREFEAKLTNAPLSNQLEQDVAAIPNHTLDFNNEASKINDIMDLSNNAPSLKPEI